MATKLSFCLVIALAVTTSSVTALTNWEFFKLLEPNITDIDITNADEELPYNAIELPGGPDDELDVEYVLQQLGLAYIKDGVKHAADLRQLQGHSSFASCHCSSDACNCCLAHRFSVKIVFKRISINFQACVDIAYLPASKGFSVKIEFNGKQMYHHEVSLKNPPNLCYGVPGLKGFAKVCVEFYNVDVSNLSMCVRLKGVIDIKVHKFSVNLNLPCFHIPTMDTETLFWMTRAQALEEAKKEKKMNEASRDMFSLIDALRDIE